MAKTNFEFQKRQRELEKKRKKEEKARQKAERKAHPGGEGGDNLVVHADRRCISRTAVDDTVPHCEQLDRWVFREALQQERGGAMVAQRFAEFLRDVRAGVRIVDHKP